MRSVEIAFDSLLDAVSESGIAVQPHPGASEAEIAEVEAVMGFKLVPQLRDLYRHANGASQEIVGNDHDFPSLRAGEMCDRLRLKFLAVVHNFDEVGEIENPGLTSLHEAPRHPFLVFTGLFGFAVECGPFATGGVMFQSEEGGFHWVARDLIGFFELLEGKYRESMAADVDMWGHPSAVTPTGIGGEVETSWRWD